ncbi:winged helix-turn-helix domain-containing protein [Vibrio agarivorans]|uniref:winged helix-turn-helix domain-containing protein n=1 Tax=Vibrio agarivorans TaxID=153622 RepID=UPI0025B4E156|nr:winged helix-turn-helix domain-containing protein [Vibrio agarivorans]MDN3662423.1 winged helix-turn-helix domain-containing protein [Vibrio agarivorans]
MQNKEFTLLRAREANLLKALVEAFPEVLSRTDIETQLWKDSYATNATINQTIKALRFSLKDEARTIIRTIPKKGYVLSRIPKIIVEESNLNIGAFSQPDKQVDIQERKSKLHISMQWLVTLVCLPLVSFYLGHLQATPEVHERISHQYRGDWYLSNDIPQEVKQRLSDNSTAVTQYVLKDKSGLKSCHLVEEVMTCNLID